MGEANAGLGLDQSIRMQNCHSGRVFCLGKEADLQLLMTALGV